MASASNGATTTATSHSAVAVIEPPESASSSSHHHLPYTNGGRERGVATTAAAAPTVTKGVVVGDRRAREKEEEEDNEDDEELRPTPITRSNTLHLSVGAESDDDDEDDCEEDEQQHSHRGRRHHQGGGGGGRQEGGSRRRMRAALTEWQKANAPSYSPAEADLMILPQHDSDDFGECVYSPSRSRDAFRGGDDDFPLSRSPPFEPHSLPPEVFVLEEEMGGLACPPGVGGAGCSPVRPPPVRPPPNNAREAFQLQVQDALEVTSGERMFAHCDTNLIEEVWMEKKPKIVHGYLFGRVIGEGSYAKVKEVVEEETLVRRAVKIIKGTRLRKIQNGVENVEREINILKKIHHPNVIQLIESFRDHSKNKLYMIFEFCISSLQQILDANPEKKMGEGEALYYFRQLLKGLDYLHSRGVVHKDIKPGNLLVSSDHNLKITDFGVAEMLSPYNPTDLIDNAQGTPKFQPPEAVSGGVGPYAGFCADVWGCGVTLYNMLSGEYPFEAPGQVIMRLFDAIARQPLVMPRNTKVSEDAERLLRGLMEKNPVERWTIRQAIECDWARAKRFVAMPLSEFPPFRQEQLHRPLTVFPFLEAMFSREEEEEEAELAAAAENSNEAATREAEGDWQRDGARPPPAPTPLRPIILPERSNSAGIPAESAGGGGGAPRVPRPPRRTRSFIPACIRGHNDE